MDKNIKGSPEINTNHSIKFFLTIKIFITLIIYHKVRMVRTYGKSTDVW